MLRFARQLILEGKATFGDIAGVDREATSRIEAACKFALSSPEPRIESVHEHVLAEAV